MRWAAGPALLLVLLLSLVCTCSCGARAEVLDVSVTSPPAIPALADGDCSNSTDCLSCTANASCGWCVSQDKCVLGNETGPANGGCLVWNYRTCPVDECERHEGCLDCTLAGGCGWCNSRSSQALCVSGNATGPYASNAQCPLWEWNPTMCSEAKQCANHTNCGSCINDTNCGWCSDSGTQHCFAGNASTPYGQTCEKWSYGVNTCNSECFSIKSCDACSKAVGCGWCNSTSLCLPGTPDGPSPGTCEGGENQWYYTKCPAAPVKGCGVFRNCSTCVDDPKCGWCVNNGACYAREQQPDNCTYFRTGNCRDPCADKKSCYQCSTDPMCGWCNSSSCVSGNTDNGPATGECFEWQKSPDSCNNTNCTDFLTCESCTKPVNTHCGWCEYTMPYKCLYIADPPPKPHDPQCMFNWFYGSCPAPRDCRDYNGNCKQCTALACWYCGTNGCRENKLFQNCFQDPDMCDPKPPHHGDGDSGLSGGEIAGIVIGSICGAALLIGLGVLGWYRFYWLRQHYYEVLR